MKQNRNNFIGTKHTTVAGGVQLLFTCVEYLAKASASSLCYLQAGVMGPKRTVTFGTSVYILNTFLLESYRLAVSRCLPESFARR